MKCRVPIKKVDAAHQKLTQERSVPSCFLKNEHVGRNALQHQAKFKQLTADACVTFQGMRGARHGVSHGKTLPRGK